MFFRQVTLTDFLELQMKSKTYKTLQSNMRLDPAHQNSLIPIRVRENHDKLLVTSSCFVIRNSLTLRKLHGTVSPKFYPLYSPYRWGYKHFRRNIRQENRNHRKSMRQNFDKIFVWREKFLDIDITYPKNSTCEYVFGIQNMSILQRKPGNLETVSDEK